ncbi:MAG: hypothetical protein D6732_00525 [Methanobacteriota archaeon]|nr:MAG: hypothetical protein D6732_00525 [Euryarchaeota archaeon]
MSRLDYNGIPDFRRERVLVEPELRTSELPTKSEDKEEEKAVTKLFNDISKTYIRGEKLKEKLKLIFPGQTIPVDNDLVAAACRRVDAIQTNNGTIIPYSVFTAQVDFIVDQLWQIKRRYEQLDLPPEIREESFSSFLLPDKGASLLTGFITGSGAAGALLASTILLVFYSPAISALSFEDATKAIFLSDIPFGIAVLLELGVKVKDIIDTLKAKNIDDKNIENLANELASSSERRKKALESGGINTDDLREAMALKDARTIVDYCIHYISGHSDNSHITYDHWIAYANIAKRQLHVRAYTEMAPMFSRTFRSIISSRDYEDEAPDSPFVNSSDRIQLISDELESAVRYVGTTADEEYQHIVNVFMNNISDRDLCCLVELFGAPSGSLQRMVSLISASLKLLAADVKVNFTEKLAIDLFAGGINLIGYSIIKQIVKIYDRLIAKLERLFNKFQPYYIECTTVWHLKRAIEEIAFTLKNMLIGLISELAMDLDRMRIADWTLVGDRRWALEMAAILDALASGLASAESCADNDNPGQDVADPLSLAASSITREFIANPSPSLDFTTQELKLYFPNLKPSTSTKLGLKLGPDTIKQSQIQIDPADSSNCGSYKEILSSAQDIFGNILKEEFGE